MAFPLVQTVQSLRSVQIVQIDSGSFNVLNDWNVWNYLNPRAARLLLFEPILDQQACPQQEFHFPPRRNSPVELDKYSKLG
jgi:hypothetical protein